MKLKKLSKKFKENKIKLIIAIVLVGFTGGAAIGFISSKDKDENAINKQIFAEEVKLPEEETKEEEEAKPAETKVPEEKPEVKKEEQPKQEVKQEKPKSNDTVNKDKPSEVKKAKEEPKKEQPKQPQKEVKNTPITYKSKGLGIAFDMPASWKDKYVIKDNGTEINVYMKHKDNFNHGIGYLFTITSNIHDYGEGDHMDSMGGIPKHATIGGRQYLVGGPLDFRMYDNDPLVETFKTMVRESHKVVGTIRKA